MHILCRNGSAKLLHAHSVNSSVNSSPRSSKFLPVDDLRCDLHPTAQPRVPHGESKSISHVHLQL